MFKSLAAKAVNLTSFGLSLTASLINSTNAQESRSPQAAFTDTSVPQAVKSILDTTRPDPRSQVAQVNRSTTTVAPHRTNPSSRSSDAATRESLVRDNPPVKTATVSRSLRDIRVLVADSDSVQVAASDSVVIRNAEGETVARLQPNQAYWASQNLQGIQIGNGQLAGDLWLESESGLIWVNDRWYAGRVRLINTGQSLLAVNVLDLETYLTSVVGAEMPSNWHPEALKAQAIAARSYAVALMQQPSSNWYDLLNDERAQVYLGLESVTSSTIAAVQSTEHQILVQDGQILMAEYASTEEVTRDAHHGRGMSQTTAQKLANGGQSSLQILGQFYQGAALASLL